MRTLLYAKMLKETTETEETRDFVVMIFIIGAFQLDERGAGLHGPYLATPMIVQLNHRCYKTPIISAVFCFHALFTLE